MGEGEIMKWSRRERERERERWGGREARERELRGEMGWRGGGRRGITLL